MEGRFVRFAAAENLERSGNPADRNNSSNSNVIDVENEMNVHQSNNIGDKDNNNNATGFSGVTGLQLLANKSMLSATESTTMSIASSASDSISTSGSLSSSMSDSFSSSLSGSLSSSRRRRKVRFSDDDLLSSGGDSRSRSRSRSWSRDFGHESNDAMNADNSSMALSHDSTTCIANSDLENNPDAMHETAPVSERRRRHGRRGKAARTVRFSDENMVDQSKINPSLSSSSSSFSSTASSQASSPAFFSNPSIFVPASEINNAIASSSSSVAENFPLKAPSATSMLASPTLASPTWPLESPATVSPAWPLASPACSLSSSSVTSDPTVSLSAALSALSASEMEKDTHWHRQHPIFASDFQKPVPRYAPLSGGHDGENGNEKDGHFNEEAVIPCSKNNSFSNLHNISNSSIVSGTGSGTRVGSNVIGSSNSSYFDITLSPGSGSNSNSSGAGSKRNSISGSQRNSRSNSVTSIASSVSSGTGRRRSVRFSESDEFFPNQEQLVKTTSISNNNSSNSISCSNVDRNGIDLSSSSTHLVSSAQDNDAQLPGLFGGFKYPASPETKAMHSMQSESKDDGRSVGAINASATEKFTSISTETHKDSSKDIMMQESESQTSNQSNSSISLSADPLIEIKPSDPIPKRRNSLKGRIVHFSALATPIVTTEKYDWSSAEEDEYDNSEGQVTSSRAIRFAPEAQVKEMSLLSQENVDSNLQKGIVIEESSKNMPTALSAISSSAASHISPNQKMHRQHQQGSHHHPENERRRSDNREDGNDADDDDDDNDNDNDDKILSASSSFTNLRFATDFEKLKYPGHIKERSSNRSTKSATKTAAPSSSSTSTAALGTLKKPNLMKKKNVDMERKGQHRSSRKRVGIEGNSHQRKKTTFEVDHVDDSSMDVDRSGLSELNATESIGMDMDRPVARPSHENQHRDDYEYDYEKRERRSHGEADDNGDGNRGDDDGRNDDNNHEDSEYSQENHDEDDNDEDNHDAKYSAEVYPPSPEPGSRRSRGLRRKQQRHARFIIADDFEDDHEHHRRGMDNTEASELSSPTYDSFSISNASFQSTGSSSSGGGGRGSSGSIPVARSLSRESVLSDVSSGDEMQMAPRLRFGMLKPFRTYATRIAFVFRVRLEEDESGQTHSDINTNHNPSITLFDHQIHHHTNEYSVEIIRPPECQELSYIQESTGSFIKIIAGLGDELIMNPDNMHADDDGSGASNAMHTRDSRIVRDILIDDYEKSTLLGSSVMMHQEGYRHQNDSPRGNIHDHDAVRHVHLDEMTESSELGGNRTRHLHLRRQQEERQQQQEQQQQQQQHQKEAQRLVRTLVVRSVYLFKFSAAYEGPFKDYFVAALMVRRKNPASTSNESQSTQLFTGANGNSSSNNNMPLRSQFVMRSAEVAVTAQVLRRNLGTPALRSGVWLLSVDPSPDQLPDSSSTSEENDKE